MGIVTFECNIEMINYNGKLLTSENLIHLSINRGFSFGDGLFETIIASQSIVYHFDYHWLRLSEGANTLGIVLPFTQTRLLKEILNTIGKQQKEDALYRIKLQVWRQGAGKYSPESEESNYMIHCSSFNGAQSLQHQKVGICRSVKLIPSSISRLKTLSALNYVMAAKEKQDRQLEEIMLLNHKDEIVEAGAANLFFYDLKEKKFMTPSLNDGCVNGTIRKSLLNILSEQGYRVEERSLQLDDLHENLCLYTCNVASIGEVLQTEGQTLGRDQEIFQLIREVLPY